MTEVWERRATYGDGSLVKVGDNIRYHQAPGGLMSPPVKQLPDGSSTVWCHGTAVLMPRYGTQERRAQATALGVGVDEVVLKCDICAGRYHFIFGHVIEKR